MPAKISPVYFDFTLEKSDLIFGNTGDPTKIKVRLATMKEIEYINSFLISESREFFTGIEQFFSEVSIWELHMLQVFLVLSSCNITEDGKPIFRFQNGRLVNRNEFEMTWERIDKEVSKEIIDKVHQVNKIWKN